MLTLEAIEQEEQRRNPPRLTLEAVQAEEERRQAEGPITLEKIQAEELRRQEGPPSPFEEVTRENIQGPPEEVGFFDKVGANFEAGGRDVELANRRWDEMLGNDSPENQARIKELKDQPHPPKPEGLIERGASTIARMAPIQLAGMKKGAERGAKLGLGVGGISLASGLGAPATAPLAAGAFGVGMTSGTLENIGQIEAGLLYDELLDEDIDKDIARPIALVGGGVNGALELGQIGLLLKTIPGAKKILTGVTKEATKKALTSKTVQQVLKKAGVDYSKFLAGETTQEVAQETTNIIGGAVAREISNDIKGTALEHPEWWEDDPNKQGIFNRLLDTAVDSGLAFAGMGMPGSVVTTGRNIAQRNNVPPVAEKVDLSFTPEEVDQATAQAAQDLSDAVAETREIIADTSIPFEKRKAVLERLREDIGTDSTIDDAIDDLSLDFDTLETFGEEESHAPLYEAAAQKVKDNLAEGILQGKAAGELKSSLGLVVPSDQTDAQIWDEIAAEESILRPEPLQDRQVALPGAEVTPITQKRGQYDKAPFDILQTAKGVVKKESGKARIFSKQQTVAEGIVPSSDVALTKEGRKKRQDILDKEKGILTGTGVKEDTTPKKKPPIFTKPKPPEPTPQPDASGKLKMTRPELRKTLSSVGDVYVDGKLDKELKGLNQRGEEVWGYPYQPDYFLKSDLSGKPIRHYVTLPDGRIAHPDELHQIKDRGRIDLIDTPKETEIKNKKGEWDETNKKEHLFTRSELTKLASDAHIRPLERKQVIAEHKGTVERALENGEYVPEKVLAEYKLQPTTPSKVETPPSETAVDLAGEVKTRVLTSNRGKDNEISIGDIVKVNNAYSGEVVRFEGNEVTTRDKKGRENTVLDTNTFTLETANEPKPPEPTTLEILASELEPIVQIAKSINGQGRQKQDGKGTIYDKWVQIIRDNESTVSKGKEKKVSGEQILKVIEKMIAGKKLGVAEERIAEHIKHEVTARETEGNMEEVVAGYLGVGDKFTVAGKEQVVERGEDGNMQIGVIAIEDLSTKIEMDKGSLIKAGTPKDVKAATTRLVKNLTPDDKGRVEVGIEKLLHTPGRTGEATDAEIKLSDKLANLVSDTLGLTGKQRLVFAYSQAGTYYFNSTHPDTATTFGVQELTEKALQEKTKSKFAEFGDKNPIQETKASEIREDLDTIARHIYQGGKTKYNDFVAELKRVLGESWDKVKHLAKDLYEAAKSPLANERGMVGPVYHGSGAVFEKFATDKIGTGEGAQAFGWGLYFTEPKSIGEYYAKAVAKGDYSVNGRKLSGNEAWAAQFIENVKIYHGILKGKSKIIRQAKTEAGNTVNRQTKKGRTALKEIEQYIDALADKEINVDEGALYTVSLHKGKDPSEYDYLRWDEAIPKKQMDKVQKQAQKEGHREILEKLEESNINTIVEYYDKQLKPLFDGKKFDDLSNTEQTDVLVAYKKDKPLMKSLKEMNGVSLYNKISQAFAEINEQEPSYKGEEKEASLFLLRAGIDGIKYPSGSLSGVKDSKSFNYVVFDENAITIEEAVDASTGKALDIIKNNKGSVTLDGAQGEALRDLASKVYQSGKTKSADFTRAMKKQLGEVWDKVKHLISDLYEAAKRPLMNERGMLGGPKATGFQTAKNKFTGKYDKKPRFEIDDNKAKTTKGYPDIVRAKGGVPLGDVLEHDELYKQYPLLKQYRVVIDTKNKLGVAMGAVDSPNKQIIVAPTFFNNNKPTENLLHEVQHIIQKVEDWAQGSYLKSYLTKDEQRSRGVWSGVLTTPYSEEYDALHKKYMKSSGVKPPDSFGKFVRDKLGVKLGDLKPREKKQLRKEYEDLTKNQRIAYNKAYSNATSKAEFQMYHRHAGEIESRDTAARANLTAEERKAIKPYSSENISEKDAIVSYEGDTTASINEPTGKTGESTILADIKKILGDDYKPTANMKKAIERANKSPKIMPSTPDKTEGLPKYAASINLERIKADKPIKESIIEGVEADKEGFDKARRGNISHKATQEAAAKIDPVKLIKDWKPGTILNAAESLAVRNHLNTKTHELEALKKEHKENPNDETLAKTILAIHEQAEVQKVDAGVGTEQGRALSARRIQSAKQDIESKNYAAMLKSLGGRKLNEDIVEALAKIDAKDVVAVNNFIRGVTDANTKDKIYELWINALLSGPQTHAVNITSNFLTFASGIAENVAAVPIEAVRAAATGTKRERFLRETPQRIYGALAGIRKGIPNAIFAFNEEMSPEQTKIEQKVHQAIKGKKGKVVRIPGRALVAADEFFKAMNYTSALYAEAYRKARLEGKKGQELVTATDDYINNPTKAIKNRADAEKLYRVFQKELGAIGQRIMGLKNAELRNGINPLKYIIPFVRTPTNIAKYGLERTPLNVPLLTMKAMRGELKGGELSEQAARTLVGSMAGAWVASLALEGLITGGGPDDKKERESLYRQGWQPYSIKVGGKYLSYGRLEPLGMVMGLAADAVEIADKIGEEKYEKIATLIVSSLSRNLASKTFLRGITDVAKAISQSERYGATWVQRFVGTTSPTIAAQLAKTIDPVIRKPDSIISTLKTRVPGLSKTIPAKRNLWGEVVTWGDKDQNKVFRFLSPVYVRSERTDKIDTEMTRLGHHKSIPSRKQAIRGVELTPKEYDNYIALSGQSAKKKLDRIVNRGSWDRMSEDRQKDLIDKTINNERRRVRDIILRGLPKDRKPKTKRRRPRRQRSY